MAKYSSAESFTLSPARIARTRLAVVPICRAARARRLSLVSAQLIGEANASTHSLAVAKASNIDKSLAVFAGLLVMSHLMICSMSRANESWTPLGRIAMGIAAKLIARRDGMGGTPAWRVTGRGPCAATGTVDAGWGDTRAAQNRINHASKSANVVALRAPFHVIGQPCASAISRR